MTSSRKKVIRQITLVEVGLLISVILFVLNVFCLVRQFPDGKLITYIVGATMAAVITALLVKTALVLKLKDRQAKIVTSIIEHLE